VTSHTLFVDEVAGNFVALSSAAYDIHDAFAGTPGLLPKSGDIISMWGGRSDQKQNGDLTLVAIVTGVERTTSGWTITTLNQGEQADTSGVDGFDTITVSDGGRTWTTEHGFYTSFSWLLLASARPKPSASSAADPVAAAGNPS